MLVPSVANSAGQPNIVLVFIDDMGWGDFSCFGNHDAQTPNIDWLATEGVRFEQFYVNSPICSPSRTAISTGQYPQRWRITSYLNNRKDNNRRGLSTLFVQGTEIDFMLQNRQGPSFGAVFDGTEGKLEISRNKVASNPKELTETADNPGPNKGSENIPHLQNFADCVKSRDKANADIEIGQRSITNHGGVFLQKSDQAFAICRAVNSPSYKILFDIYHQQITERNLIPNIDLCWNEIGYFQTGDNPGRKEPGTGEINYARVLQHPSEFSRRRVSPRLVNSGVSERRCYVLRRSRLQ